MIVVRCLALRVCLVAFTIACVGLCSAHAAGTPSIQGDPSDELFTNSVIRHLSIEIADTNMTILRAPVPRNRNASDRPSVPATVREGTLVWTNVAVHLKGSLGSYRRVDDKPALTLNFDKLAEKQRFHGLQKISLNNSVQDPSYVSEKICRSLYTAARVPMPRVDYATVELNGRHLGLFVLAEGWNKQFLRRHFTNVKGNFYDLGNAHDVNKPMDAEFGEYPTRHTALEAVTAAMNEPDHTRRLARLRATLDLDLFLSMHALDALMWNWDGYGINRNNYRMFHDLAAGRIAFLPHGLDQMFWKSNGPIMTGTSGLVAKSLLETAEGRRLYLDRFTELRTNILDVRSLTNRIAELTARLQPVLKKEGLFAAAGQQQAAATFSERIVWRVRDVDAQLAGTRSFTPMAIDGPTPLTRWTTHRVAGDVIFTNVSDSLRVHVRDGPGLGAWTTTLWLEQGRYRIEGRVKTAAVMARAGSEDGAGFRVWSQRKDTRGATWGWFPYGKGRDTRLAGLLPVAAATRLQRLTGDTEWTTVTHEFELREPLTDLQIQCVLQAPLGAAWFESTSLTIRRLPPATDKSRADGD